MNAKIVDFKKEYEVIMRKFLISKQSTITIINSA